MDDDEKKKKMDEIQKMQKEKKPEGRMALLKYYVKRYWYIAIPVHIVSCLLWYAAAFLAVKSGVDVVSLLEHLRVPEYLIGKVRNMPPHAGYAALAFVLYKIASPLRYATTIAGIKLTFTTLQKMGKLKTAKEVTYKMRTEYAKRADRLKRRYSRFTKFAVRSIKKRDGTNGKK
ncbi:unnamed protein product [Enterobius vermicularis]|uniref:DUF1279 domain-containing protein n=1 Tax=Enterobius vermicularis TaxID=51028 RepID=A0A0N4VGB1_ENTVE|nr:unnamed protein product [Enterobius vermicularis]